MLLLFLCLISIIGGLKTGAFVVETNKEGVVMEDEE